MCVGREYLMVGLWSVQMDKCLDAKKSRLFLDGFKYIRGRNPKKNVSCITSENSEAACILRASDCIEIMMFVE